MPSHISISSTFEYKLIYVFRINDGPHKDCLKVGDATIKTDKCWKDIPEGCHDLNVAAKERIDSYTSTAGISYDLLHTEIAVYKDENNKVKAFRDYKVHEVLKRSGIASKFFDTNKKQNEWFVTDLETVKNAIKAVKSNKSAINSNQITTDRSPIIFRPEQKNAINKTISRFKDGTSMLWNAKMRFGKTLSALQVAKEMNFSRTIIVTHRPVVSDGWFKDFEKIFYDRSDFCYCSKHNGHTFKNIKDDYTKKIVYFASIQDLRGSSDVGGNFDKNNEIFKTKWDFIIVDEAHEGTQTNLGKNVIKALTDTSDNNHKTYTLELSGTPFNILSNFEKSSIYTWDYIMEQEAKALWNKYNFGDSNPYAELPKMNIFTYHLEKNLPVYLDVVDKAFNFKEFFRVWTGIVDNDKSKMPDGANIGDFVHEKDVVFFLDLICKEDEKTNYPFATEKYRDNFRHSLWVVPGVKEAKALSALLKKHPVFKHFTIVNVAGDGDEEIDTSKAREELERAMTNNPEDTYTITLSCGRLTTGVTVPEWTAVLMLAGSYSTAASQYLQTIFRVQSPANINGKIKEECYVFDFAPDRTLKMIAESVQLSARAGASNTESEKTLGKFLNYCSVIAVSDSNMKEYCVPELLQELKKAYVERVTKNGFDDPKIYNDELLKLTEVELNDFEELKGILKSTNQTKNSGEININDEGFSDEELEAIKKIKNKPKKERTSEEEARIAELKDKRKNRDNAISILRGISIRMPLLVYGMNIDIDTDVTVDNFTELMRDENGDPDASWNEFMPKGVTKEIFKKFAKYYDKDIFVAASRRIRMIAKAADELDPTERVVKIANLFNTFKNPDKETILTPWRVVNMHMSDTLGGWDFYNELHENMLDEPRFVDKGDSTEKTFNNPDAKILEINSKTGLYPLYATYSIYRHKLDMICDKDNITDAKKKELWLDTVKRNIFVICKTPMAKKITQRTLLGYSSGKINAHHFEDLVNQFKNRQDQVVRKIKSKSSFWDIEGVGDMEFDAIIGNPPYQVILEGNKMSLNVYHEFIKVSIGLNPKYVSLITPSKWMGGELGPYKEMKGFFDYFAKSKHLKLIHDYASSFDVFDLVDIKGGVSYFLYDSLNDTKLNYVLHEKGKVFNDIREVHNDDATIIRFPQLMSIITKVKEINSNGYMSSIVSSWNPYGFISDFFEKNNEHIEQFDELTPEHDVTVFGLLKGKRMVKYISRKDLIKDTGGFTKYKVFVPRANGTGAFGEKFSTPILGLPIQISTDTFLEMGPFETKEEAQACFNYIKTKFFRAMVGAKKTGVFNYKDAFQYVPIQLFKKSDIDWKCSIENIDNQLFKKYQLSHNEIEFIEEKVQPME